MLALAVVNSAWLFRARGERLGLQRRIRLALGASPLRVAVEPWLQAIAVAWMASPLAAVVALLTLKGLEGASLAPLPGTGFSSALYVLAWCAPLCLALALAAAVPAAAAAHRVANAKTLTLKAVTSNQHGMSHLLLVLQVSVSLALCLQASILFTSLRSVTDSSIGVSQREFISLQVFPTTDADDISSRVRLMLDATEELRAQGVRAAVTTALPLSGRNRSMSIRPFQDLRESIQIPLRLVGGDYFELAGIVALRGRTFQQEDRHLRVAVVNAAFARMLSEADAIGRHVVVGSIWDTPVRIIGVVPDVRHDGVLEPLTPEIYVPLESADTLDSTAAARFLDSFFLMAVGPHPAGVSERLRAVALGTFPGARYREPISFEDLVWKSTGNRPMLTAALSVLAVMSLVLLAVGLHGTLSHMLGAQTRTLAIRLAVGASPAGLVRATLRPIALALGIGAVGAFVLSWALSKAMASATLLPPDAMAPDFTLQLLLANALVIGAMATAVWLPLARLAQLNPGLLLRTS
ncbi:MAG: ABC transporter permease [Acidobacteriota bacterium]|nr:ABC transporter permease [Acidobacteriota bacterium]